jgi:hypothetical protein
MRLVPINTDEDVVESAAQVVEFHAGDLPEPGPGFRALLEHTDGDNQISRETFDKEVMNTYQRDKPMAGNG